MTDSNSLSGGHSALYSLQHATLGSVLLDQSLSVVAVSADASRLLGFPVAALLGRTLADLHPHGTAKVDAVLEHVRQGENGSTASTIIPVPGRLLLLKVTKTPDHFVLSLFDADELSQRHAVASEAPPARLPLLKLPVNTLQGIELLDFSQVLLLRAAGRYAVAQTCDQRERLCSLSLKVLADRLPPSQFLRVHRTHIINLQHAKSFHKKNDIGELILSDGTSVPIGRSRVSLVRGLLGL